MTIRPHLVHVFSVLTLAVGAVLMFAPSVSSQQRAQPRQIPQQVRPQPVPPQQVRPLTPARSRLPSCDHRSTNRWLAMSGVNALSPTNNFGGNQFSNGFGGQFNGGTVAGLVNGGVGGGNFGAFGGGQIGFQGTGALIGTTPRGAVVVSQSNPLLPLVVFPTGGGANVGFGNGFGTFPGGFSGFSGGLAGFPIGFGGNLGVTTGADFGGFAVFPTVGGFGGKGFGFNGGTSL